MTDRVSHFVVGLRENLREDDIDNIVTALRMVSGVLDVRPVVAQLRGDPGAPTVRCGSTEQALRRH